MHNQKLEAKISVIRGNPWIRDSILLRFQGLRLQRARVQMHALCRAVVVGVRVGEPRPWEPARAQNHIGGGGTLEHRVGGGQQISPPCALTSD